MRRLRPWRARADLIPARMVPRLTFTATVTATGGNPSGVGTVTFKDGGNTISECSGCSAERGRQHGNLRDLETHRRYPQQHHRGVQRNDDGLPQ